MIARTPARTGWLQVILVSSALALAGCGGSSSSSKGTPPAASLSGTAAVGAAIVSGTVTARCADGSGFTQAITTDTDGNWSGTIANGVLPCALQVTGGTPAVTLHGYASATGTINITPLTDLILALATGTDPASWFAGFDGTAVNVDQATSDLLDEFSTKGFRVPATGNPFTTAFSTDGTGWDGLLDDLADAIANDGSLADYAALLALIRDGNLNTLPDSPPPEMYAVSGSITGASGTVIWELIDDGLIHNDGGDGNGPVTFTQLSGIAEESIWSVEINTAPAGQTCEVTNGSGTLTADVTDVLITCSDLPVGPFAITGTISGATGAVGWATTADALAHHSGSNGNGAVTFTLPAGMASGATYNVSITSEPLGQSCEISNNAGTLTADITNVAIVCTTDPVVEYFSITGTISNATADVSWATTVNAAAHHSGSNGNGAVTFTLPAGMESGASYAITVTAEPAGQDCTVSNGAGTLSANVTNVIIACDDEVTPPDVERLYDFSSLDLQPTVPTGVVPSAPAVAPIDPGSQIASLFAQLGAVQTAALFAPPPVDVVTAPGDVYNGYYFVTEYAPDYSWARQLEFGNGVDGIANTADDVLRGYSISPWGVNTIEFSYVHPGQDNTWFTDDDVLDEFNGVYFPNGALLEYEGASEGAVLVVPCLEAGDDGLLFTEDDQPGCSAGYSIAVLDGAGYRGQVVYYNGPGSDGLWFTADDRVKTYTLVSFNAEGVNLASVTYNGDGANNLWFDGDDDVQLHTLTLLNDAFLPEYTATYNNRGADSTWFTADDTIQSWGYFGYDGDNNPVLVATHTNKGADTVWFTADDYATGVVNLKNADGRTLISSQVSGSGAMGPDGKWLSGDENFSYFYYYDYDANGNQTRSAQFNGAGADGLWFTTDDVPYQYNYWDRVYDAEGRIVQQINYNPANAPSDPAFSESHISQYKVYNDDFSISVTVTDFGADNTPFTADDSITWPYAVAVPNGYDRYNQPGADGIWFTADDVLSGYVRWQYSGNRKTLEQEFNALDELVAYSEATPISATVYRWDNYYTDGVGGFDLTGYAIIEEDANGFPLWTIWYDATDVESYVEYTERDATGNILRQGWGYSPGADMTWGTLDDFAYLAVSEYQGSDLVSAGSERPGTDGVWGTGDDTYSLDATYLLRNDVATLAMNTGSSGDSCASLPSGSGDINVQVVDENGAALSGVVVQLNQNGATATTDANGEAGFAGLSGNQDVHFFKDGYSWESFYCVAPGLSVTVQSKLSSLSVAQAKSKVSFYLPTSERVTLRLLDGSGNMINARPAYSLFGELGTTTYPELHFDMPAGTEVSGTLWAFKVNGSDGRLMDAQNLGAQTFTTIATNTFPGASGTPLSVSFSEPEPARLLVAEYGVLTYPPGLQSTPNTKVELQEMYPLPLKYESTYGKSAVTAPDATLPTLAQPTALSAITEEWSAWYPATLPAIGVDSFITNLYTGFQQRPYVETQDGSGSNPVITWTGARQLDTGSFLTANTVDLISAANGLGWMSHWQIHTPAGDEQVTLPSLPAGITDAFLPETSYGILVTARAVPGVDYHSLVGEEDLHALRRDLATETLKYGAAFSNGPQLQR